MPLNSKHLLSILEWKNPYKILLCILIQIFLKKISITVMSHTAAEITGILFYVKGQITLISHYYMTLQFYNI